jgi:hypothetical protein
MIKSDPAIPQSRNRFLLGQIHAAFAYYYDHQAQIDAEIERQLRDVDERSTKAALASPIRRKLRAMGKLP